MLAMIAILMAGLSLAIDALLVYGKRIRADRQAAGILVAAKKSLIAYAVMQGGADKRLPCPFAGSVNDYGQSAPAPPTCGADDQAEIGLLPWTTLQRPPLWDSENGPVWYALSGHFKPGTTAALPVVCGAQTNGLTLDGTVDYVAVLFAPGKPLPGQTRNPTATPAVQNAYLDEENGTATTDFVAKKRSNSFNDRVLGVTCDEIR